MNNVLDLAGVGIGPFNLSLAALLDKTTDVNYRFFDQKECFSWHSEIIFEDSDMQTSYLKDLVTSVDPTSPYTFLNYLVENGLFYVFMNTGRNNVTRKEFETYLKWVAAKMSNKLQFNSPVSNVNFDGDKFILKTKNETFQSFNLCVGTGITPRIPECARDFISKRFFHAKSSELKNLNVENLDVMIIGGGQTGIEIFRNLYNEKWGAPKSLKLITGRNGLQPLDESPFTNEFFSPQYVDQFFEIDRIKKEEIVKSQKYASDGNTPHYLEMLYKELYQFKYVQNSPMDIMIYPNRRMHSVEKVNDRYKMVFDNQFTQSLNEMDADIVILCTGFENAIPEMLSPIKHLISFDDQDRFVLNRDFSIKSQLGERNKIYALNFSRHGHGISEPQTSLMAWRSATVINSLLKEKFYNIDNSVKNLMSFV